MDRVEYAHSIDTGTSSFDVVFINYFDQLMGLYGFMQPCNYEIKVIDSNDNFIIINLKFSDKESALKITNILNSLNHSFQIYGRSFVFDTNSVSLDTIQIKISS